MSRLIASVIVFITWCIPGSPHRWAVRLNQERRAVDRIVRALYPIKKESQNE